MPRKNYCDSFTDGFKFVLRAPSLLIRATVRSPLKTLVTVLALQSLFNVSTRRDSYFNRSNRHVGANSIMRLTTHPSAKILATVFSLQFLGGVDGKNDLDFLRHEKINDYNLKIKRIRIRSVWLGHGFFAALASCVTGPLTGSSVTHWWVEIETTDSNTWYCAEFTNTGRNKGDLSLTRHNSRGEVTRAGKRTAGRMGDNPSITNKYSFTPVGNPTIGDIARWMECQRQKYNLIDNNCQHFAESIVRKYSRGGLDFLITTPLVILGDRQLSHMSSEKCYAENPSL